MEDEDYWYLRRLDGGLFTLQTVDYILAWIMMEDDGVSGQYCYRGGSSLMHLSSDSNACIKNAGP